MAIARLLFGLLFLAAVFCFARYALSADLAWRRRGIVIVKWALVAAFVFFAVLIGEKIVDEFL